jgi:GT2 family glycosyltransferase
MKLSIIIVNWNTSELLAQCLHSIQTTVATPLWDNLEVFVVDNGSTDGSIQMVRGRFPWVRVIVNKGNLGFVKANNQAIPLCKGEYVLLLNSDTVVWPHALQRLVTFLDVHPEVGVVGGELRNADDSLQPSWNQFPSLLSELSGRNFRGRQPYGKSGAYLVDWIGGACMMVRATIIKDIGNLDENIFMYSEETDWCYRIRKAGWSIAYLPGACITHLGGASSSTDSVRFAIELYKSKLYFFQKHYGSWHMYGLKFGLLLRIHAQLLISFVCKGRRAYLDYQRYRSLLTAIWRGNRTLYENRN